MKILHGMSEIAGQGSNTVKGLRANGHYAMMAVWQHNVLVSKPDIDLKINKEKYVKLPIYAIKIGVFAVKSLVQYDVLHSHFGESLLPFNLDAYFYHLFNFKCFSEFHGSDIRFMYNMDIDYPYYKNNYPTEKNRKKNVRRLNRLLKHVNGIIIHDYELLPHLPNTGKPVFIVPLRVNVLEILPQYPKITQHRKPVIVHAPSKRATKGTEGILKKLREVSGDYELILVENTPHKEAMEIYRNADIIIDMISYGTYGVLSIEAMAMGKPVITYLSPEVKAKFPKELPIVSTDFDGLPKVVDYLIANPQIRYKLGVQGRKYVERYHDHVKVTRYLYDIYDGKEDIVDLFKVL